MTPQPEKVPAEDLAQFVDHWTVRYVRLLPASVPRVWQAVTRAEELNLWFIPVVEIDARPGGRCSLSWGQSQAEAEVWTVTRFEPRKVFELTRDGGDRQFLRFELEPVDASTRLTFTNAFDRAMREDDLVLAAANPDDKLLALPAGTDSPIRAGILEGYHLCMDGLAGFLERHWRDGEIGRESAGIVAQVNDAGHERFHPSGRKPSPLAELYYDHIREHCPPAA